MKIATIAALALTLALPSLAQQSATKIVTENGQPTLALDEQLAARLRSGRTEQNAPATVPSEFSAAAPGLPLPADANHAAVKETAEERNRRMEWWRDAKFGMFIHYGLYSGLAGEWKGKPGGSEWIQKNVEGDTDSYAAEALPLFKPKEGLTEEWARLARDAGCQYVVLTSKHHEGFGLFDSAQTDYDAKSAVNRDIIREYVDSCRKRGLKVGLYHSVIDWHHPSYDNTICPDLCYPAGQAEMLKRKNIPRDHAAYQKYLHAQVRELMTRYAPIDIMWWDYSQGAMEGARGWKAPELMDMVRSINPGVIMNNRLYAYSGLNRDQAGTLDLRCGDYITPERFIPRRGYPGVDWESCMTVSDKWGYNRYDTNIKSPETVIEKLVECVTKGGNLLLNVNPMADGTVPEKVAATMRGVGQWLKINGEAVYGTRAFTELDQPASINRQGDIFVFLVPPPDKGPAQPPSEGTMKELTEGAEYARMQPLDSTGYEDEEGTSVSLPAGYSKAVLLGDNTALPVVNGTVLFKAHEHSKTPCSVIKLSK
ncbi:alpha-L-fucosidase [Akkermansia sp.]|uniref:alpha-L-fucosidase n=1 Tax=Akkermansia sp. TaxID=1872421 RepID=UPI0025BA7E00|nr:alpha-L-fucosidase [Akkermansia sp.]